MKLRHYQKLIKPEHWEEFQQLISEDFRSEKYNFENVKKEMSKSPQAQSMIELVWGQAAEVITSKYSDEYFNNDN